MFSAPVAADLICTALMTSYKTNTFLLQKRAISETKSMYEVVPVFISTTICVYARDATRKTVLNEMHKRI